MNKPEKFILQRRYLDSISTINENFASKQNFLEWCQGLVPDGASNISLKLSNSYFYDDVICELDISWDEYVANQNYDKEIKKYNNLRRREKKGKINE